MASNPRAPSRRFCDDFLSAAGCRLGKRCPLRHDIKKCTCGLVLPNKHVRAHLAGKRHQLLENLKHVGPSQDAPHPAASAPVPRADTIPVVAQSMVCDHCGRDVLTSDRASHMKNHANIRKKLFSDAHTVEAEAEEDKNGVTVSHKEGIDFGVVAPGESLHTDVTIIRTGPPVVLETISIRGNESSTNPRRFSATLAAKFRWVKNGKPRTLAIQFLPSEFDGEYKDVLELVFLNRSTRQRFLITRRVFAVVGSKDDHEQLKPKTPYQRRRRAPFQFNGPIVPSLRPPTWGPIKWTSRLLPFDPPPALIQAAFGESDSQRKRSGILHGVKQFVPSAFNLNTYAQHFQTMLYIEEEQKRVDLEGYALTDVQLVPDYPRYKLQVKGLEDGRPAVIVGDFILVRRCGEPDATWYEGRVHRIQYDYISLRFDDTKFNTYKGNRFDVRFTLNRLPHRRMHQGLTGILKESRILFPVAHHLLRNARVVASEYEDFSPVNRLIAEDEEQLDTVLAIVNQPPGSPPFVVFGPPGTGKTVTIVEAIHQILLRDPAARVLACAPSNKAADLIAQKLTTLGTLQLFRLNSLSRKHEDLPRELEKFSSANDNLIFAFPVAEDLAKYRVIVATCLSAGVPANIGLKRGHFSHIFCDEAGQALEPECMLPVLSIADKTTNIVLAGDNQQLGPIVSSWIAQSLGLKTSYLTRIMQRDIYSLEPGTDNRGITIVKLVKNFRSHPAILRFSNEHFYNNELQPCGNRALIYSLEDSPALPKKKFPLIFHGIVGKDDREGTSPSFFNISEASQVKKYVVDLVFQKRPRVRPEEIGIITPYHAQRCKIIELLHRDPKLRGITVGSVEEFQGQERRVIIMSTVRSNENHLEHDLRRTLGFVANRQRFNVAITRAQALLIVIGNPDILGLDPLWREFLNYVHSRGGCRGKEISWNSEDPIASGATAYDTEAKRRAEGEAEEMITRLKSLIAMRNDETELDFDISDDGMDMGPDNAIRRDAE
ncbi:RNA helicase [Favolaschia claudopus]|uniref:RNA helicase n=1 Tax=Favolaschia claudopus TaxID=2862362 RepID=A0AAW0DNK3_9AGAR